MGTAKGQKLPTAFYVWFRTNAERFTDLIVRQGYSLRAAGAELKWARKGDMSRARELLTKHEASIARGDWKGVEQDLFGCRYSYYEKLPSVQRAFHELRDPRASGKPPASRPRAHKRRGRKEEGRADAPTAGAPQATPPAPAPTVQQVTDAPSMPPPPASADSHAPVSPPKPQAPSAERAGSKLFRKSESL